MRVIQLAALLSLLTGVAADSIVVGDTRVTALSATLVRIEPRGPRGFADGSSFNVVGRQLFAKGLPISIRNQSSTGTWLQTPAYMVFVPAAIRPQQCSAQPGTDAGHPFTRLAKYRDGLHAATTADCCAACSAEPDCRGYTSAPEQQHGVNCWPFEAYNGTIQHTNRSFGALPPTPAFVAALDGRVLWSGTNSGSSANVAMNLLHWPSPLEAAAYAFEDSPRFAVPAWGPTPIPPSAHVPAELRKTNGFDFSNDVRGDTYIFLLGSQLEEWWHSRHEFLQLTGPTPLLPDWAYGVW